MADIKNPIMTVSDSRSPEIFAGLEILWAGLGDLVSETEHGTPEKTLNYYNLGADTDSIAGDAKGDYLLHHRDRYLACWTVPEKSNGMTLYNTRQYALRFIDTYKHIGGSVGHELASDRTTTELLVGRWAIFCSQTTDQTDETPVIVESPVPLAVDLLNDIDLNKVLQRTKSRFDQKKQRYQNFRDLAREIQAIDIADILLEPEQNFTGDISYNGMGISEIANQVRSAANSSNNIRLTLFKGRTLWAQMMRARG